MKKDIVFKEICKVCLKEINFIKDYDYIDDDGVCRAVRAEGDAIMCDPALDSACFRTYHAECFDQHQCPVHEGKSCKD